MKTQPGAARRSARSSPEIAVIGMAVHVPGARELSEFWENVLARRRQFRPFPDCRLPLAEYYDTPQGSADKTYATRAAFIDGFEFDWAARRIPERTYQSTDIVHWLALDVALKALDDAGYSRSSVPTERTAVIVGNSLTGEFTRAQLMRLRWPYVRRALRAAAQARKLPTHLVSDLEETMEDYYKSVFAEMTEDTLAGVLSNTIAGRICNYLDLHGGGYVVDGACASGMVAAATAADQLAYGDCDFAIVGGVDISLDPVELVGFARVGALTTGEMNVYDKRGTGFIPGEGCGFLVLRRLADARSAGDNIYAVIRGWGISSDGKGGITKPRPDSQAYMLQRAYSRAGYGMGDLAFIEGHGTGTSVGDKAELEAVQRALDATADSPTRSIGMTSLKSLLGHTKAASGALGLIKAVIAVNRRIVPPFAGCHQPNPVFADSAHALYPVTIGEAREADEVMRAGAQAMGFGGINCHIALESGPGAPSARLAPSLEERALMASFQETELMVLTAWSAGELRERLSETATLAAGMSDGEMADLAAHLARGADAAAPVRAAIVCGSPAELAERLEWLAGIAQQDPPGPGEIRAALNDGAFLANNVRSRIGFLFPGQGAQHLGMAQMLVGRFAWARELVESTDTWLRELGCPPVGEPMLRDAFRARDAAELHDWRNQLSQTHVTQPAVALASVMWLRYLEKLGVTPAAVGGHSLGELTALHAAGAYGERALMELAAVRGRAMSAPENTAGLMVSLGCDSDQAEDLLRGAIGYVTIANVNAPRQTVIAGDREAVEAAAAAATAAGVAVRRLPVSNAFHSKFMEPAAVAMREQAPVPAVIEQLRVPFRSGLGGERPQLPLDLHEYLGRQVVSAVDWISLVRGLSSDCDLFIEAGPGRVLSDLVGAINGRAGAVCLPVASAPHQDRDLNRVVAAVFAHGADVKWDELYAGRLIRPFIPASRRNFIRNPIERPFNPSTTPAPTELPANAAANGHANGDPARALADYLDRRGQFLIDVIRADIGNGGSVPAGDNGLTAGNGSGRAAGGYAGALPVGSATESGSPSAESTTVGGQAPVSVRGAALGVLVELVAEQTGFPPESLSPDLRLLDDLNLDSIKVTEVVTTAFARLAIPEEADAGDVVNASLGEIADVLERLKPQPDSFQAGPQPERPSTRRSERSWVRPFAITAVPEPLPALPAEDVTGATVLIVHDPAEAEPAASLAASFRKAGATVVACAFGEAEPASVTHVVGVLPHGGTMPPEPEVALEKAIRRLRDVYLTTAGQPAASSLTYIQSGGPLSAIDDTSANACAGTAAFAAGVHHERPELKVRVIDAAPDLEPATLAERVLAELASPAPYAFAGYDAALGRRVLRPRILEAGDYKRRTIEWSPEDVFLITGGAKGITAECALALARHTGASMALVGSSAAVDGGEVAQTLERFASEGLTARYYQCDITRRSGVDHLIANIRDQLGPVTGVLHGAGANTPRRADQVTLDAAYAEAAPKVLGAIHLANALSTAPLKLFAALSSIIGVTGMPGNSWYGFANEALDATVRQFAAEHPAIATLSLAYSVWGEVGMGARMGSARQLGRLGVGTITTAAGVNRFIELIKSEPGTPQVVVTGRLGGLDTWCPELPSAVGQQRFLDDILSFEPGVELAVRTELSLERDPYLRDHVWEGSPLLPAVFGLEAMAEAAFHVTGVRETGQVQIDNVRFHRPVMVDRAERGTHIEIRAEVAERQSPQEPYRVRTTIRAEQTGFARDHFEAEFVLGLAGEPPAAVTAVKPPRQTLDIDPKRDLYGPLLFQGPAFQRLRHVYELDTEHLLFGAEAGAESGHYLLGDLFFLDSMLQAGQVVLPQEMGLPVEIERVQLYPARTTAGPRIGLVSDKDRRDEHIGMRVSAVDEQGNVVTRLENYRVRVMKYLQDNPTTADLVSPEQRDTRLLRGELTKRAWGLGLVPPQVALAYRPGRPDVECAESTKWQESLIGAATARVATGPSAVADSMPSDGRSRQAGSEIDYAVSHDDDGLCIAAAGNSRQACQVLTVTQRTRDEWRTILGPDLDQLLARGEPLDRAGSRVWALARVMRAPAGEHGAVPSIIGRVGDSVAFRDGDRWVLTFAARLTRGTERMFAFLVTPQTAGPDIAALAEQGWKENIARRTFGFDASAHRADAVLDGPGGHPAVRSRIPVTFREAANPSGTLYFSHYPVWAGELREMAIQGVFRELASEFISGKWGMVTNRIETSITGEAGVGDVLDSTAWMEKRSGQYGETQHLCFDWGKRVGESVERVAWTTLQTTWVEILGHGVVEPRPLPDFLQDFMDQLMERFGPVTRVRPRVLDSADLGPVIATRPAGPVNHALLSERTFGTTLEDANLVGNIYFANYITWQGRVRDKYFHDLFQQSGHSPGPQGELRCRYNNVEYLREAMPFDQIAVRMSLDSLHERGVRLAFDYFKVLPDGSRQKLAHGKHVAEWLVPSRTGPWRPSVLPDAIHATLASRLSSGSTPGDARDA